MADCQRSECRQINLMREMAAALTAALTAALPILDSSYLPMPNGKSDPEFGKQIHDARVQARAALARYEASK